MTPTEFFRQFCIARPKAAQVLMDRIINDPQGTGWCAPDALTWKEREPFKAAREELGISVVLKRQRKLTESHPAVLAPEEFFARLCETRPHYAQQWVSALAGHPSMLSYWIRGIDEPLISKEELERYDAARRAANLELLLSAPPDPKPTPRRGRKAGVST